jgi:hypothetical protein
MVDIDQDDLIRKYRQENLIELEYLSKEFFNHKSSIKVFPPNSQALFQTAEKLIEEAFNSLVQVFLALEQQRGRRHNQMDRLFAELETRYALAFRKILDNKEADWVVELITELKEIIEK